MPTPPPLLLLLPLTTSTALSVSLPPLPPSSTNHYQLSRQLGPGQRSPVLAFPHTSDRKQSSTALVQRLGLTSPVVHRTSLSSVAFRHIS
jgi:hypothetical protein